MKQEIDRLSLQEAIDSLEKQKRSNETSGITIYDFAKNYRVIEYAVGTIVGLSLTYIIRDVSFDIINPIIKGTILKSSDTVTIFGINFNIDSILSNIIFAVLSIVTLYIIITYFIKDIATNIIVENKNLDVSTREYQLQNIALLADIKNKLGDNYIGR
jgi:large-conductance mechanosensitive channel